MDRPSDYFEERAAIAEFDGGMSREQSEAFAAEQERTWNEQKFQCEVRQLLTWKRTGDTQSVKRVLEKRQGEYRQRLIDACKQQWERGNRGDKGAWIE